ncbi:MAG TPA: sigma factor-like helix-turn-helix DNA-binding protein [Candidatus Paceibacterota bacterium]|nr:sigma factor-like helix-turn-helix DNA-binding protein [Candidatus Paceibacterota bacterium]
MPNSTPEKINNGTTAGTTTQRVATSFNLTGIAKDILAALTPKSRAVLEMRFGLVNDEPQTLEAIGQAYHITRERVRQIENNAFSLIDKKERPADWTLFEDLALTVLKNNGGAMESERFYKALADELNMSKSVKRMANFARFFLKLSANICQEKDSDNYYSYWHLQHDDSFYKKDYETFIKKVIDRLQQVGEPVPFDTLYNSAKNWWANLSVADFTSYCSISKQIQRNPFNEYGLTKWYEIKPRGVKDRAYAIMKHVKKPLHFSEISKLINEPVAINASGEFIWNDTDGGNLWKRNIQVQTVHNELIKDKRFVLVGRGIYALTQWGYQPGTVRQVLQKILGEAKEPLTLDEIVSRVKEQRVVKDNTILLNLQNKKYFAKTADKRYMLKK